jgi:hypothetical protein
MPGSPPPSLPPSRPTYLPPLVGIEAPLFHAGHVRGEHGVLVPRQPPHLEQNVVPLEEELGEAEEGGRE